MTTAKLLIGLFAVLAYVLSAAPAHAAAPSNDTIAGATAIMTLPFSDSVDTTDANTDPDELAAAQPCLAIGAPAIEKGVWYRFTASAAVVTLVADTAASSYSTGIAAYNGTPSASTFAGCAPRHLSASVAAGDTAYLMVFCDTPGSREGRSASPSTRRLRCHR